MKICLIQPRYSFNEAEAYTCFKELCAQLEKCDDSMDIIVLPEYSDALADVKGKDGFYGTSEKYGKALLDLR